MVPTRFPQYRAEIYSIMGKRPRVKLEVVKARLEGRGIEIFELSYRGVKFKANFICKCGHSWRAQVDHVASNRALNTGCPVCAQESRNEKLRGRKMSAVTIARIKATKKANFNEETRLLLRNAQLGKTLSAETRRKIGDAHRGMRRSEETKKRMSAWQKGIPTGRASSWTKDAWAKKAQESIWISKSKSFHGFFFYVMRLSDGEESFYKGGRTFRRIAQRKKQIPYDVEIVKLVEGSMESVFEMEQDMKRAIKKHKYTPKKKFGGIGECFSSLEV